MAFLPHHEGGQDWSTLHEVILDVLEARFGAVPYELRGRILAVADETDLKRFHRQAALVESLERFAQGL